MSTENPDQAITDPTANEVAVLKDQLSKQSTEMENMKSQLSEMTELLRMMVSRPPTGQTSEETHPPPVVRPAVVTVPSAMAAALNTAPRQEASAPVPVAMAEGGSNAPMDHGEVFTYDLPGTEPNATHQVPRVAKEPQSWREEMEKLIKERIGEGQPSQSKDLESFFMFPKVELPPKFKVPQFTKYKGDGNPEYHLKHYCTKLGALTRDEGVLLLYFHESLEGPAYNWYMQLDHSTIKTWGDMAEAFRKYYRHNLKNTATRDQIRAMSMRSGESFRAYAARWRQVAMEVRPIMDEKEMITYFVRTLPDPFYGIMLGSHACEFSDLIETGDLIDMEAKEGRLGSIAQPFKRSPNAGIPQKKKEEEVNLVGRASTNPGHGKYGQHNPATAMSNRPTQPRHQRNPRPLPELGLTNSQLYHKLLEQGLIGPKMANPVLPPYPNWYRPELTCEYHMGTAGHSIENCETFQRHVWKLLDNKAVTFEGVGPDTQAQPAT